MTPTSDSSITPLSFLRIAGCSDNVIRHCMAVRDLALRFCERSGADTELVEWGAMLHDIGRARSHGLDHGQLGADMCRSMNIPEEIARIVECHIGAGLTADQCRRDGLKEINCVPSTIEEKIVAHADNLIRGTEEITLEERLRYSKDLPEEIKKRIIALAEEIERYRSE
ncbi:phosphohydrolase [Methanomicrobiaceae archaeon CYW5]|uniref:HDIG domain-containing metalloprotein n=1 Tax=Methanovulcanius yangii TaxID=1789227 RepID=UPI0029CA9CB5|nr:HDIG domain-containing metalloprotein [Methanovulcanius yangii]MBT8507770.1 phosphohydrolase [Methanovulcanius yangii]